MEIEFALSISCLGVPTDPDYVPFFNPRKENVVSPGSSSSMARFQRAQRQL